MFLKNKVTNKDEERQKQQKINFNVLINQWADESGDRVQGEKHLWEKEKTLRATKKSV